MPRILIVGEERSAVDALQIALRRENLTAAFSARLGAEALELAMQDAPDLVVLDIELPDMSGFDLAVALRRQSPDVGILFLTARGSSADKLMGFGVGADDYVTKPFEPLEVVARIRALLRRVRVVVGSSGGSYAFGRFEIRPAEGRVVLNGQDLAMPAREFKVLAFLAEHRGTVHSASEIYRAVWADEPIGTGDNNTVSVHVHRLRERIEPEPTNPRYLVTVRGLGYKLVQPE
jgi:two-component system, OmpR family, response regulator RegX3